MPTELRIDFVSDVSCPWCIIGLRGLEMALANLQPEITAEIRFHPFELNPQMGPEGENIVEHIGHKYGASPQQSAETRQMIKLRAADLGFDMRMTENSRIYNTFDAHRLLHWAALEGRQHALKHALFSAYFTDNRNMSDHDVLLVAAAKSGLDAEMARKVLAEGRFAEEVRAAQRFYRDQGIHAVPAIIINGRYLISGGQPVELFEKALRQIAAAA
ncbi:putative DsbA family dithiol-disulfide isomerase [Dongia mobilis]|uniref:Putative DsbA family dithiol-disulfide isomerase n=1 Tax=Dongia mobilis TaxID=578943 RepID=A0A4R6WR33_9PROT|nr:DsbA family oxidoreductase [Dongia mobilis]TDQ84062.1 putative DsbA family dithiol-disulfide isomerase [Dongia mobilis]